MSLIDEEHTVNLSGLPWLLGPTPSGDATGVADTTNVQDAINFAGVNGYLLALRNGTYTFTNLTAPSGGGSFGIAGQGPGRTFCGAPSTASGYMFDLTYAGSAPGDVQFGNMNINLTNSPAMVGVRTQKMNRLKIGGITGRYGAIVWEHVQTQGNGPVEADWILGQNQTSEVFHLTGSSGLGCAGSVENLYASITDTSVVMTQGVLIDWFTVGWVFNNVQVLGNVASSQNIHKGIVYTTAAPAGNQGAFLFFTHCVADQMDTGNGLDLTNARGVWSDHNFWSVYSGGSGQDGVAITGGKEQTYTGDWISGRGMSFASAPDKITIGSGCKFPQTQAGGALVMPGANPPTNVKIAPDVMYYSSITNILATLEAATNHGHSWGRAGAYV